MGLTRPSQVIYRSCHLGGADAWPSFLPTAWEGHPLNPLSPSHDQYYLALRYPLYYIHAMPLIFSPLQVASKKFDFIIVGMFKWRSTITGQNSRRAGFGRGWRKFFSLHPSLDLHFTFYPPAQTCGLVLANRLSENPKFSVLVLEAGNANIDDPLISKIHTPSCLYHGGFWGIVTTLESPDGWISQMFDSEYDWMMASVPQKYAKNRVVTQTRFGDPLYTTYAFAC